MLPAVGDGEGDRSGRDGRFRQLDGPLGQLGADGDGVAAASRHGGAEGANQQQPGNAAGRNDQVSGSYTLFLMVGWQQYRSSGRLRPPRAYSVGNKLGRLRSPLSMAAPRHTRGPVLEPSELERFEAVVLPHLSAAYRLARYLTQNDADADDVVQEAFLRALKYFGGFRGRRRARAAPGCSRSSGTRPIPGGAGIARMHRRRSSTRRVHSEAIADEHPGSALAREVTRARRWPRRSTVCRPNFER